MISEKVDIVLIKNSYSASLKWRSYSLLIMSVCCWLLVTDLSAQTGPGGVGNSASNRLWLKADSKVYNDLGVTLAGNGNSVQQWNDNSGNNNNAIQNTPANRPFYKINIVNSSPAIQFTGNTFLDPAALGIPGNGGFSIILVFQDTSFVAGAMSDGSGDYIIDRTPATNELTSLKITDTDKYGFQKRDDGGLGLGGPVSISAVSPVSFSIIDYMRDRGIDYRLYLNGSLENSAGDADGNLTPPIPRIGRHATTVNNGIKGYIAEVMIYNYRINNAQINIINSYLAAKYGLTVANNKYSFGATHKYDVAGIGRVDAGNLHSSATSAGVLNVSNPSALDDGDYLLFGHDNGSISSWNTEAPSGIVKIPREWKLSETNDVGTISITVDVTSFLPPPDPSCAKYVLLVDADGDFSSGAVTYDLTSIGLNQYKADGISTTDGDYVSIGVRRAPTASISPDPAIMCAGGFFNMNGNPAGGSGTFSSHLWSGSTTPLSSVNIENPTFTTTTANNYNLTYTVTDSKGCTGSDGLVVTVVPDPTITVPPVGATICEGGTHTMSVTATNGTPSLTYQWEESNDNGSGDPWASAIGGTGSTTDTYTSPVLNSTIYYRVVVSATGNGCTTAASAGAEVTVVPDPLITAHPAGADVCYNSAYSLSVTVSGGTALNYQWEVSPNGIDTWSSVGVNSSGYTTPAITSNRYYRVIVSSTGNGCSTPVVSNVASVLLETVAPVITGSILPIAVQGCAAGDAPPAVSTVADLEALGLNITDACTADGNLVVNHSDASAGSCPTIVTRTYTITDESGNSATYNQTINVRDLTGPVITGSIAPTTVEGCNAGDATMAVTTVAELEGLGLNISDACTADGNLVVTHSDASSGLCTTIVTRTYTVTDECGNGSNYIQTINVKDQTPPVITGSIAPTTVEGCTVGDVPAAVNSVAGLELLGLNITDACTPDGSLVVTHVDVSTPKCPIVIARTYTITDNCSNSATYIQTINIDDQTQPVITGSIPVTTVEGCSAADAPAAAVSVAELELLGLNIVDACTADVSLNVSHSDASSGICNITVTRTYTVIDGCDNVSTYIQTIIVDDQTAPVITGAIPVTTVEGCGAGDAPAAAVSVAELESLGLSIADACTADGQLAVTHSDATSGTCPTVITRTYTITDKCLNAGSYIQTINVDDQTPPAISGSIPVVTIEGCNAGAAPVAVNDVAGLELLGLNISDACTADGSLVVAHSDASSGRCPIVVTRTYTITDDCGNAGTYIQTINIDDQTPPLITGSIAPSVVEGCGSSDAPAAAVTVADLELLGLNISDVCSVDDSLVVIHSDAYTGSCPTTVTRTYTITDRCGNASSYIQTITVDDQTPPVITGSIAPTTVEGCGIGDAPAPVTTVAALELLGLNISDACTPDVSLTVSHSDGMPSGTCPRTFDRTYTVTDGCSNANTYIQTINIDDNTSPVITGSIPVTTVEGCGAADAPAAAATVADLEMLGLNISDVCTPDVMLAVTYSDAVSGTCPTVITRTYTVTDGCGNTNTYIQTINVDDQTSPVITGSIAPITVEGCLAADAPVAASTVADLELLGLNISDACTADGSLVVTHNDTSIGTCPVVVTRTYTITDDCGNFSTYIQIINVNDLTPPAITGSIAPTTIEGCNIGDVPAAVSDVAGLELLGLNITDACTPDGSLVVTHIDDPTLICPIVIARTYTITDNCGNTATYVQTINIDDQIPPVITGSIPVLTVEGCGAGDAPAAAVSVAELELLGLNISDVCTIDLSMDVSYSDASTGTCPVVVTRTYTVSDGCHNPSTYIQTINVDDQTAPVITGSIPVTTVEGCNAGDAPVAAATVADLESLGLNIADACAADGSLVVTHSDASIGTCPVIVTRTYTVTDECGNASTYIQTINVDDTTPPTFTAPADLTIFKNALCGYDASVGVTGDVTDESDNCDVTLNATFTDVISNGACTGEQVITRTWSLSDDCGNSTSHVQVITAKDNTPPTFTAPADILIYKNGFCGYNAPVGITGDVTDEADNCDGTLDAAFTDVVTDGACAGEQIITRTWSLTDDCGNTTSHVQVITATDNTAPTFTAPPDITIYKDDVCGYDASVGVTGDVIDEVDNCDVTVVAVFSDLVSNGACFGEQIITRTWSLTDGCGNSTSHIQTITVKDNTAPTFTAPADITIFKDASCAYDASVGITGDVTDEADNCDNTLNATFTDAVANGICVGEQIITRTWSLTDDCGNTTIHVQTITVKDNTPPTFTVPADIIIFKDASCAYDASVGITGDVTDEADNCDNTLNATFTDAVANGVCAGEQIITRTWSLTDDCGNTTTQVQIITVRDNTAPTFTAPADIIIFKDASCAYDASVGITGDVTDEADNCDNTLNATFTDAVANGSCAGEQIITRTWSLTDDCGNTTTRVQIITARDNTAPTFTVPADIIIFKDASCAYDASVGITGNVTDEADNCDNTLNATFTDAVANGICVGEQIITRTWSLTDDCGNTTTHIQIITARDNIAPTFTAPADITIFKDASCTYDASVGITGDVTDEADNCDNTLNATFTDAVANGICVGEQIITRTWSLTDDCGNTTIHVQTITVKDNTPPTFTVPADIIIFKDASCAYDASVGITGDVTDEADNCDNTLNATFTDAVANGVCAGEQIITRTWSLTDDCGNTTTQVQIITVRDNTAPTFTAPADIIIFKDASCAYDASVGITGDVTDEADNCDNTLNATFTDAVANGICVGEQIITRTWSLTDDCGNTTTHIQIITARDNIAPTFTAPADITIFKDASCTYDASVGITGDVTDEADNCDNTLNATFTDAVANGACAGEQIITRTWSLTDDCGNTTTHVQTITARDNTAPTFTVPADIIILKDASCAYDASVGITGDVTDEADNCDNTLNATFTDAVANGSCAGEQIITRTWSLTDDCGNTTTQVQIITARDNTAPTFTAPSDTYVCRNNDCSYVINTLITGDVSNENDNCSTGLNATYTDDNSGALDCDKAGIVLRRWSLTDLCGNAAADQIQSIYVNPKPSITVAQSDVLLCYTDGSVGFNINTTNTMTPGSLWRYDVSVVYPSGVTGSWASGLTDQTVNTLTDNLTNTSDIVQTVTYTFTPHIKPGDGGSECQNGIPIVVTVDLDPQPKIAVTADQLLCYDGDATFNISTVNATLHAGSQWRYDVSVVYPAGVTGSWASGLTDQTVNTLTDNLTNTTDVLQTVTYTFTPHIKPGDGGTECNGGLPIVINVDLDPQPKLAVTTDQLLCYDGDATFNISTVNSTLHAGSQWRYDVSVVYPAGVTGSWAGGLTDQTLSTLTDNLTNTTDNVQTVVYTFTPHIKPGDSGPECQNGVPVVVSINLDPQPKITVTTDQLLCYDGDATFNISTVHTLLSPGSQWRYDVSVVYPAGVTGSWSAGLTNQTAANLTDNLTSTSDNVETVIYTFTPHISPGDGGAECQGGVPVVVSINLDPQPKITVTTDQLLCHDGDAAFTISTVNTSPSPGSQWRYDVSVVYPAGVTGSWAGGLTDQTLSTLTDNLTNTTDNVQTVVYTFTPHIKPGDSGPECQNGVPVVVSINLDPQPKITVTTDQLLCYDGDATFNISTVHTLLSPGSQWRYDVSVVYPAGVTGSWSAGLTNQTAANLTDNLTNTTDVVQTVIYTFTPHIQPGDGGSECHGGTPVIVTVDLDPQPKITVTTDRLLCYDGDATFNISTVNSSLHSGSQWRYDVSVVYPAGVTGSWAAGLTNQTASTLIDNLTNTTDNLQTVVYTFLPHIKPGDGGTECNGGVPIVINVDLDPQPKIVVTADQLLCYDGDATFNISTVNATLHAGSQWRYDVSVVYPSGVTGSWASGLTDQTVNTLTDNLTNTSDIVQTVTYTFTPHIKPGDGGSECQNGIPIVVTVDLDPQPKIAVTADQLLCYDGDATFNISTVNATLHAGSQWRYDVSVVYPAGVTGSWASGLTDQTVNTLTDNLTNTTDVLQTVTYTFTPHIKPGDGGTECNGGLPIVINVDLDPQPKLAVTTDQLLCYDGDATFNISTVNSTLHAGSQWRYDVSVVYPAGVTGSWAGGLTDQTLSTLTDNLTNTTDNVQTVVYTFTPHIKPGDSGPECQNGVPVVVSINLDPQPKITVTTDQLLCYDGDATFNISTVHTLLSPGSQWRYDVSVVYPAGVTGSWASGLTDQTVNTLTDNLTNTSDIVQTVTYTFTPHIKPGDGGSECQNGIPIVVTVDLDPQPKIAVTADQLLCYDGDATFNISTVNATLHAGSQWRYDVSVVYPAGVTGSWASGLTDQTVNTLTDNLTNTTDVLQTVTYTFTPHIKPGDGGTECNGGLPIVINVDLDPQPKLAVTTDQLLCYDGDATFNISTVNSTLHAGSQWRYDVSVVYPAGVTGSWAGGLTDQTLSTLTDNLTNTTDNVQTVVYTFTPHIKPGDSGPECQNGVPVVVSINLDPQPKITVTTDQLLCYDGDATFNISTVHTLLSPGSQWRYDVSVVYPAGVTGSWSAGLTNQTAANLTDNLTSTSDNVETVIYTFTPHISPGDGGAECQGGVPVVVSINLDPQPKITVTTDQLLCHYGDAAFTISTVNTSPSPGSQWRYDVSVVYPAGVTGSWAAGLTNQTASTLIDNLTNTTDNLQTVVYTFLPHIKPGDGGTECNGGVPIVINVDLDPQPKIVVTADQLLCYDGDATFNISTVNATLHAGSQWRYDVSVVYPSGVTGSWASGLTDQTVNTLTDNLTNTSDIVQTVTYTFTPHIKPGDGGSECQNGIPIVVTVDLDPQPKIAVTADQLLCYDGDATFNISTVNATLHAGSQWRYDVSVVYPAGVTGSWASGLTDQTVNTLTDNLTNTTDVLQTVTYTFTPHIKPGDGGTECNGGLPIVINVDLDPQPKLAVTTDQLLCYDGDATFNISTVNSTLHAGSQWRYDVSVVYPAGVTGSWAGGLTDQTLSTLTDNLTNTTDNVQTVVYTFTPHIKPGDSGPECQNGVPVVVSINLDPQPKITVTTDQLLCYDGDATFNISTVHTLLSPGSQWRYDVSVVYPAGVTGSWSAGLTNQTAANLTDNLTSTSDNVETVIYTFTPHISPGDGGAECQGGVPVVVSINLDPQPKITVTTDQLLCHYGDAAFTISTVNTSPSPGSQWRYDVSVVYPAGVTGSWAAGLTNQTASTLIDNLTNTTDNLQTVVYTFLPHIKPGDGGTECNGGVPIVINVDLDPQPKIVVTADQLLCYDGDATFNISTVNATLHAGSQWRYDVSVVYPSGVTGSWASGLTDQTVNTLTDNLTNTSDIVQTVTYTFTPHIKPGDGGSECQNGIPIVVTVDLDPQPKIAVTADQLLCYDGDATFNISTVNATLHAGSQWRYDVSVVYPAGVTGSWASGLTDQTVNTLTDNLTNTTDVLQTVTYTFTPHIKPGDGGTECNGGLPIVINVDLDPQPKLAVTTDQLLCYDGDATFNISTVNSTLHAGSQWRYDVSVVYPAGVTGSWAGGLTDQTLSTLTDNLTNTTDNVQTVVYTFTPHIKPGDSGPECQNGVPVVVSINLDPQPKITVTTDQLLCYDGDATFNISTVHTLLSPGSQWRYDVSVVYPAGVTGSWSAGLTNQTAANLTDNLTNTTDVVQTVIYTFTPHIQPGDGGSECHGGTPVIVTVDLDPQPKITVTTDRLLCYDGDATFNISTVNSSLHSGSQWRYDVSVVYPAGVTGSWAAGLTNQTVNTLTDNLTNTTDIVQTVTYTFTPHIRPGDGGTECQNGVPFSITVDLDPQPKMAVTTDQLLCYDGDATFNISTVNATLHAGSQWRYDVSVVYPAGVTGSWAAGLTNQTASTLTDNLTNTTDNVQTVVYTFTPHIKPGDGGSECQNGIPIVVTVDLDPQPKIAVTADQLLCYDGDATFNISTIHTLLSPGSQWRYDVSVVYPAGVTGSWAAGLTNQTAATLTDNLTNTTDILQTVTYTFTPHIKPGDGGSECNSGVPIVINVDLDPQPKMAVTTDQLLCYDGDAKFNISTVNTILHPGSQWRYDVSVVYPAGVTGSWAGGLTNQTSTTLTDNLTNNTNVVQTVTYTFTPHIKPGDSGPECQNGVPVVISVDLDPQPKMAVITDQLLCHDGDATFIISTLNTTLHAGSQWRYDVSVVYPAGVTGSWAAGLTNQTAVTLTDDLTNTTNVVQTVTYTFTPHIRPGDGGSECHGGTPVIVTVDLDPQPKITVTTDRLLCYEGDATFNISTVNTSLHSGSQWRYDVSVVYPAGVTGSWVAGLTNQTVNTLTDNLTNTTDIVQTVTYTFTPHIRPGDGGTECQNGVPFTITVDLDPQPKITVNTALLLCYDGDATFNITTVNSLLHAGSLWRYDVSVVYPAGVTGSWAGGLTNQTSNTLTDNLTNTTDVVQTVTYTFTPHIKPGDGGSECQNGIPVVRIVQIDPQPRLYPIPPNTIQCDSIFTNIVLQSPSIFSSGSITFDQTVTTDGAITGYSAIPVNGLPNNHIIADRLVNMTDSFHTATYRIIPVSPAGCASGVAVNIKVTVNPTPRVIPLNTNLKRDSSICFGGSSRVVLTTPTVMTSGSIRFDYTVSVTGAGVVTGNTSPQMDRNPGYAISYPYQNSSDTLQSVYYNITPKVDNAICLPGKTVSSEIKVHAKPLQSLIIRIPLTCNGGSDAALRAITSKGAGLYYFDWVRWGTNHIYGYGITDLVNVKGGRWDITVTDNLGCSNSDFKFVAGAYFDSYLYVVDTTGFGTTCPGSNDGEIWIKEKSSSTGIPPFRYWLVRNNQDTVAIGVLPATEVVQKVNNLSPGTYKLILMDNNNCINLNYPEVVITEPENIRVNFTTSSYQGGFNVSCMGYNDGSIRISGRPAGGNGGYRFKWYTYDGLIPGADTLDHLDDLTAGTYYLRTTDRKGCFNVDSVKLTQPEGMIWTAELHHGNDGIYNISCNGGSDGDIKLTISGGSGNYTYSWTGPGSFTATTKNISGLVAGTYLCRVRDINGCEITPWPQFDLTEPPRLLITSALSSSTDGAYNINCFGGTGSVDITVTGGIPGTYLYDWSTSDGSGLIAGQADQPSLTAGSYRLKVTDLNNCDSTIYITLTQPDSVRISFAVKDITCQLPGFDDGVIDISVSGGISPFTFLWSNGMVTEDISGLTTGYYSVIVTDFNGCTTKDSVMVNLPPPLTYSKTISDYNTYQISCNGFSNGFIRIEPLTGLPPFIYTWTGPDGFNATTKDIEGLKAGLYTLIITDNNFCTKTDTFDLKEPGILGMTVTLSSSIAGGFNINCAGDYTGSIEIEPLNAAGSVDYLWSDGIFGKTRTGMAAGDYRVIISDGNNCHADSIVKLTEPDSIKIAYRITPPFCPDRPDGQIILDSISGGVPGYSYLWSDNSNGNSLTDIPAGKYSVTVSDLNSCSVTSFIKVDPLNESCLIIPDAISPNGDLINDVWNIGQIELYPNVEIVIYNRWGESIWKSERGYPKPWDGRSNGRDLPVDSYHYIIDLHNGSRVILGNVTVVR